MKKYQTRMKSYTTPQIEVLSVRTTCHMLDTSFPGQHNPAENGGTVGEDQAGPQIGFKRTSDNTSF